MEAFYVLSKQSVFKAKKSLKHGSVIEARNSLRKGGFAEARKQSPQFFQSYPTSHSVCVYSLLGQEWKSLVLDMKLHIGRIPFSHRLVCFVLM